MNIDFTQEQKKLIGEKLAQCVRYLKTEVQPHLTRQDNLSIGVGEGLELKLTCKEMYVEKASVFNMGIDLTRRQTFLLEKPQNRKGAKKYLCDAAPDLAFEFLQNWESAKKELETEVDAKKEEVAELNSFIDNFEA